MRTSRMHSSLDLCVQDLNKINVRMLNCKVDFFKVETIMHFFSYRTPRLTPNENITIYKPNINMLLQMMPNTKNGIPESGFRQISNRHPWWSMWEISCFYHVSNSGIRFMNKVPSRVYECTSFNKLKFSDTQAHYLFLACIWIPRIYSEWAFLSVFLKPLPLEIIAVVLARKLLPNKM